MLTPKVKSQIYRCKHTFTHPNLGKMLTKGKLYICSSHDTVHDIVQMVAKNTFGGAACSLEKFNYYFEEADKPSSKHEEKHTFFIVAVYNGDTFSGYYSAVSQPLAKSIPRAKQYKTKAAAEYRVSRLLGRQTKIIEVEASYKYATI